MRERGGQASRVFVREATGLVKSASLLDALSLNMSNMSVGAMLGAAGLSLAALPSMAGVNLVFAALLCFGLAVPQIIVYTMMSSRIPRTGGDYVWVTRSLGGFLGATLSFMGYTMQTMSYLALVALSAVFAVGSVGLTLGYGALYGVAVPSTVAGAQPLLQFVLAASVFSALIALNVFRPKAGYRTVSALAMFGAASTVLAIATLLRAGRSGVATYIDGLGASGITYQGLSSLGPGPISLYANLSLLPLFMGFVFAWINAPAAVASEIKGSRALRLSTPLSALVSLALLLASLATMYHVGGVGFTNAALSNPTLVYDYSFNFWTLAMGVSGSPLLALIIGLGWVAWNLAILAYGIIVVSRYLFAQSFDRFLPEKLSYVSARWGSPVVAHLVDLGLTVALIGLAAFYYGGMLSLYGSIVGSMVYFSAVGVGAMVYSAKKERGGVRAVLFVAGALSSAVAALTAYFFLANRSAWGVTDLSVAYLVGAYVLGSAIYLARRRINLKRGIDFELAFKEIPPE